MRITTIRLPTETERELEILAAKMDRSRGWLITQALKEYIDRHKLPQVRWQETLDAMEEVAHGRVIDSDDVHKWLKSWGTSDELPTPEVNR